MKVLVGDSVRLLIMDEADRLLDANFQEQIMYCVIAPKNKVEQTPRTWEKRDGWSRRQGIKRAMEGNSEI